MSEEVIPIRKIRIGFLMHGIFYGGASRSLFLLIKSLRDFRDYELIIYTISVSSEEIKNDFLKYVTEIKLIKLKTISTNQVYSDNYLSYKIRSKISCKYFVEQLIEDKIDILHINTTVFPQVPQYVKKQSKIKVVTHLRECISPNIVSAIGRYMIENITHYSDALIAISGNEASSFADHPYLRILPNPFEFNKHNENQPDFRLLS